MVLNPRGRGRGRLNFQPGTPHDTGVPSQGLTFMCIQPGMVCPPLGSPAESPYGSLRNFGGPGRYNFCRQRRNFGKFPGKCKKNFGHNSNETRTFEVDLTKPWVTEEIRNEESKKQCTFEVWKKTKSPENWNLYEVQKRTVQELYDKARVEYGRSHPNEVAHWQNTSFGNHYFCETCDKSFKTGDDFLLHEAEHETCGREGCEFTAHPKIIAKHIKMQHETGLYKRIGKLYTEEDINKWIEDRKKRYPTRKVVEEKKILEKEKLDRGEKIKDDDSKFNKSFSSKGKGRGKKNLEKRTNKNARSRRTRKRKHVSVVEKCVEEETTLNIRKGVPAFLGLKTVNEPIVPEKEEFHISEEEWESENKPVTVTKPILNSSLGLLAALYDSDAEVTREESQIKTETLSGDEESGPDEVSSKNPLPEQKFNEEKVPLKRKSTERKDHQDRKRRKNLSSSNIERRRLTLLEKLLKNEIRHERNVILQCVHYVVKNNFFKT